MRRTGSGGGRVPSALSTRRDSPIPKAEPSTSTSRVAPPVSRNISGNITTNARALNQTSPRPVNAHLHKTTTTTISPQRSPQPDPLSSPSSSASSSSSSSHVQSRFIRRPKFAPAAQKLGLSSSGASDGEDEPAFLPFTSTSTHDPSATLRGDPHNISTRRTVVHKKADVTQVSQTSDSSASSATPGRRIDFASGNGKRPGPLSPRRTAELAGRSQGKGREGSEGSPSMGSSFSDLDGEYHFAFLLCLSFALLQ